jgi:DNA repair photolyase
MIISASRRTDIPAFYSDWFIKRIEEGFVIVRNPMNARIVSRVTLDPDLVDCIVFWTKNPAAMLDKLPLLDQRNYNYVFQFTLTPYGRDIEPNVPEKKEVVSTFIELSDRIGKERVAWRYDPILVTDHIDLEYHLRSFERLARALSGHAERCIISFLDFYAKCRKRLDSLKAREMNPEDVRLIAQAFAGICMAAGLKLETCAEEVDLSDFGIGHGKCIDADRISMITGKPLDAKKDKYQRKLCGCAASVDIGAYDTCLHCCLYCYANRGCSSVSGKLFRHAVGSPCLSVSLETNRQIIDKNS